MRIDTRLAERLKKINPSSTLAITARAKKLQGEGKAVISFAAGEPDFDTPDFVKSAAIEAIRSGFTKYTPTTGTPALKIAICDKLKKDNGLSYQPDQIVVSCGAKHSIFNALFVLLNRGDDCLIPLPYWVSYPEMVNLCEGRPRFIKTSAKNNFKITPEDLLKHISPKTKVLILNSPSNPSGSLYTRDELKEIARICVAEKIYVISDEIYEKLVYDGCEHLSIASFNEDIYNMTVTVNGLSKSFSMTGWRLGYMGAPKDISDAVAKLQDHTTSNPCSISQKAAEAAFCAKEDFFDQITTEFQKRRDFLVQRLTLLDKISFVRPQGAFYVFCDISKTKMDSATFADRLLEEALVAVIPGIAFGRDDYIRLSFATSIEQIAKGMDRIQEWLGKLWAKQ